MVGQVESEAAWGNVPAGPQAGAACLENSHAGPSLQEGVSA